MQKNKVRNNSRQRVLIADDDTFFARGLANHLSSYGFETKIVRSITEAKEAVQFWIPKTVFINLLLPETNAMSLVRFIQSDKVTVKPRITVTSKQALPEAVDQLRRAGVENYLLKPFAMTEALSIALENDRKAPVFAKRMEPVVVRWETADMRELHLLNLFLSQAMMPQEGERSLFNLMRMITLKVSGMRSSLIQCLNYDSAVVMASDDDENAAGFPLDLSLYPDIRAVWERHQAVVIPDVRASHLMAPVMSQLSHTPFEMLLLFPVYRHGRFYGVLSLRMERKPDGEIPYIEKFGQVCSQIISLSITQMTSAAAA